MTTIEVCDGEPIPLARLVEVRGDASRPCVSIYLPAERAGPDTRQGHTRLKNALRTARGLLEQDGQDAAAIDTMLAPAAALVDDGDFWQHQQGGLAVLLHDGERHVVKVPMRFSEQVEVGERFVVRPLLPLAHRQEFLLLALSQNHVQLHRGTRTWLRPVEVDGMPTSLEEALQWDDPEQSLQFHSHPEAKSHRMHYHGQGGGDDSENARIEQFVRMVDKAVVGARDHRQVPLMLAAVDRVAAAYRAVSEHPRLLEEQLHGNFDESSEDELQREARALLGTLEDAARQHAIERFGEVRDSDRASEDLLEIARGAENGRVEELLLLRDRRHYGPPIDEDAQRIDVHEQRQPGDVELLDRAAAATIASGGTVWEVDEEQLETPHGVAARLRW